MSFVLLLMCCKAPKLITNIYNDQVEGNTYPKYINDSLGFSIQFSTYEDIKCNNFSSLYERKPRFLNAVLEDDKNIESEILFYGRGCITSTAGDMIVLVYPNDTNINNFTNHIIEKTKKIIKEINTDYGQDSLNMFNIFGNSNNDTSQFRRFYYQYRYKNDEWYIEEYHIAYESNILRFLLFGKVDSFSKAFKPDNWLKSTQLNMNMILSTIKKTDIPNIKDHFIYASSLLYDYNNYLKPLLNLKKIGYLHQSDTTIESNIYNQIMMTLYSYVGEKDSTLMYADKAFEKKASTTQPFSLEEYRLIDADSIICKEASINKVLMINEAHHISEHRHFVEDLLPKLNKLGFKYLAVETIENSDSNINKRGYPIFSSGTYVIEPNFAQLIRTAIKLGYTIISYESDDNCEADPLICDNFRDSIQARNIANIFKKDSDAKVIVYAGYDHIKEKSEDLWVKMAERFKKETNINPVTIDLVSMTEKFKATNENDYFRQVTSKYLFDKPKILVAKNNDNFYWLNPSDKNYFDIQVFMPRSITSKAKLLLSNQNSNLKKYRISFSNLKKYQGNLLQVFYKKEFDIEEKNAIPIANYIINTNKKSIDIMLNKGLYYKTIKNIDNQILKIEKIEIK
jgi:hypothetical protein